jgi:hypothetical protein
MKLTKQGVQDLNDKPSNGRRRPNSDGCLHVWKHDPNCPCIDSQFYDYVPGPCWDICEKCGQPRRTG